MATVNQKRNLGIDTLRALAMFFVICQHILGQGGVLSAAEPGSLKYYGLSFFQILAYCAVDVYGITTGYLMFRKAFRLSRLTKLWLTTVFWSVAVSCGFFLAVPESRTIEEMVSMFLPILRGRYWFFTAYFVTILLSPVLNLVINTMSRRQFKLLLAALFVIFGVVPVASLGYDVIRVSGGNHFSWMMVTYLIGGYLRVHGWERQRKPAAFLGGFLLFALIQLLFKFCTNQIGFGSHGDLFLSCTSPLVVGEAVCLFRFFREAGRKISGEGPFGKLVKFITPGIYSVYIIHVHPKVFWSQEIIDSFRLWDSWSLPVVLAAAIGTALAVFLACVLLDAVRQWLFRTMRIDPAAVKCSDAIEKKVRALLQ